MGEGLEDTKTAAAWIQNSNGSKTAAYYRRWAAWQIEGWRQAAEWRDSSSLILRPQFNQDAEEKIENTMFQFETTKPTLIQNKKLFILA